MSGLALPDLLNSPGSETQQRYLTFWSNNQLFGAPIADIMQIVEIQEIVRLPDFPSYVKGVIILRGDILPILDMRLRMGNPEVPYTERSCIIVAAMGDILFGFIADEVDEVLYIPQEQISSPPRLSDQPSSAYLSGIGRLEKGEDERKKAVFILDLSKLLSERECSDLAQEVQNERKERDDDRAGGADAAVGGN